MLGRLLDIALGFACSKWVKVHGYSMVPALFDDTWVRVDRWAYRRSMPRRLDVVLVEHPQRVGFWEVKRVVGLPGEHVELVDGVLMIDGDEVDDALTMPDASNFKWQLGAGQYVVLGDNRPESTDSRTFGPVESRHIAGRVEFRR